jgi:hypothetical protein
MATAARACVASKTRKGRTAPTVQPSTNFIANNSTDTDNLTDRQAQRLVEKFGMSKLRARVVAGLAWEAAHG